MTKTPNATPQPNYPDQIISNKPQPGAEHAVNAAPISADLRRMAGAGAKSAPITLMTEDRACKWAWDQVREDAGTDGWTAGESCTFYGFFLWGWNYRGQYETQRPAAPTAPAGGAVPDERQAFEHYQCDRMRRDLQELTVHPDGRYDCDDIQTEWEVWQARAALAAAPAQAVAVPQVFPLQGDESDEDDLSPWQAGGSKPATEGRYLRDFDEGMAISWFSGGEWTRDGFFASDIQDAPWRGLSKLATPAQEHATQLAGQGQAAPLGMPWRDIADGIPAWTDDSTIRVIAVTANDDFGGVQVHDIPAAEFHDDQPFFSHVMGERGSEVTRACTHWVYRDEIWPRAAFAQAQEDALTQAVREVVAEIERAQLKFPTWPTDPLHALGVLGEEFGELTKDVLQLTYEPGKTTAENMATEALQTAAMALRFYVSLPFYQLSPGVQHDPVKLAAARASQGDRNA